MDNTTQFDSVNKIWSGPKPEVEISESQNFGEIILEKLAEDDSDRVFQIDGDTGETFTTADIRLRTIRCAQNLTKLGCGTEQRIAIIARNHRNLTPLLYTAFCIGSPITPIDIIIIQDGAAQILQRIEPKFIFCDDDVLFMVKKITDDIGVKAKIFSVRGSVEGFDSINDLMNATGREESFVCTKIIDSTSYAAVIACSSGTTGLPKSVCISHALLTHVYSSGVYSLPVTGLCFSSLYWFSGVLISLSPAFGSTRVFTSKPFSTDLLYQLVEKYKIQYFLGPSCQIQSFLKSSDCKSVDLSSLMVCYLVGSFVPTVLIDTLKEIVPDCSFMTTYGLTEIGGGATVILPNELEEYPNSVGSLSAGVQMKIISEETHERCGIVEACEIYVRNRIKPMGYYKDDIANQTSFDEDGFLITGDIGYFDETGRLYISGRKKEIFKNQGFSIWPTELEEIIQKHRAVRHVCVVSVFDDEIKSDLPAAVIVKSRGHSITQEEIYQLIASQLASYKWLDGGVYFVDELPMTPSEKPITLKVKQMAQNFYEIKKQKPQLSKL